MRQILTWMALMAALLASAEWIEMSPAVGWLDLHYRVRAAKNASFGIDIAVGDTLSWRRLEVSLPSTMADDITGALPVKVRFFSGERLDSVRPVTVFTDHASSADVSMRLIGSPANAVLEVGDRLVKFDAEVSFADSVPLFCRFFSVKCPEILRESIEFTPREPVAMSRFATKEQLFDYLSASTDHSEAVWTFYDRDATPLMADTSGEYILATVRSDSGYDLVFISDRSARSPLWRPLQVKAVLKASDIPGVFDVVWFDRSQFVIDAPVNAVVDGSFLTVNFPYYKSSLRFSRSRPGAR